MAQPDLAKFSADYRAGWDAWPQHPDDACPYRFGESFRGSRVDWIAGWWDRRHWEMFQLDPSDPPPPAPAPRTYQELKTPHRHDLCTYCGKDVVHTAADYQCKSCGLKMQGDPA